YVSAFKAKVTVKVKSIAANAPAHHSAIGAPYTAAKEVTAPIAMSVSPSHYFDTVKLELAKAIKAGLTTANDIGPERYRFFKTTTTTPAVITDLLANQTPTIDVGTENLKVKAKVTLALAQAVTTAFNAGPLNGRTVAVPTDSAITNNTVIKEYKSMSEDWEVTEDMMKEVGAAIKAAVGATKIGTAADKYAFFTANPPTQASYISAELDTAGTLTKNDHHGKIIYIGLLK
ncbi:MAG: hypothetical protein ACTTI3_01235, partial [Treponema sp.]